MPPIIMMSDWSKLPDIFFPKVSLTEVKQQVNQVVSQKDIDLKNVDWPKIWADILNALGQAGRLLVELWNTILSSALLTLIEVNDWSIVL
ncbi:hypothetical protein BDR06DRAFT_954850 [Suillus hirtellus]|nr:hypothetical protein BDR06DRAFT_954850 [Suillus hirtellus]